MTLKEYQVQAQRTCPSLENHKLDLCHMVLGIMSEEEELIQAIVNNDIVGVGEEIIDAIWYLANYCTFRDYSLQELYNDRSNHELEYWENSADINTVHLSKLQDYVKKFIAYNKPINNDKEKNSIKVILWSIDELLNMHEIDLETALQNNIDKLRVRFPDKFSETNALNRDLESERRELSK